MLNSCYSDDNLELRQLCVCVWGGNWIIVLKYDLRLKGLKVVSDRALGGGLLTDIQRGHLVATVTFISNKKKISLGQQQHHQLQLQLHRSGWAFNVKKTPSNYCHICHSPTLSINTPQKKTYYKRQVCKFMHFLGQNI